MSDQSPLGWTHRAAEVRERQRVVRQADAVQCAALSRIYGDPPTCHAFSATYHIDPLAPGRYRVSGRVTAAIGLICGVTLEPIEQSINETFDIEFRADARLGGDLAPDFDAFGDDDPEPIEHGNINVGRLLMEIVASAIDPFPRADDATLDQTEAGEAPAQDNPFAALAQLKRNGEAD